MDNGSYDELSRRWTLAAPGVGTEEFHKLMAQNVARSSRAGHYPGHFLIGGQLCTGTVTREGVEVRKVAKLDDAQPAAGRA